MPVNVCIATYMFLGAQMFVEMEKWDLLTSLYHAYVTMATIGLGDYYPGKNANLRYFDGKAYLVVAGVYMTIGMVVISMCFTLIQEEAAEKIKFWAKQVSFSYKELAILNFLK